MVRQPGVDQAKTRARLMAQMKHPHGCSNLKVRMIEPRPIVDTLANGEYYLAGPPLAICSQCDEMVAACPRCERRLLSLSLVAEWHNHYRSFAEFGQDAALTHLINLLGEHFPRQPIEAGHRFYT